VDYIISTCHIYNCFLLMLSSSISREGFVPPCYEVDCERNLSSQRVSKQNFFHYQPGLNLSLVFTHLDISYTKDLHWSNIVGCIIVNNLRDWCYFSFLLRTIYRIQSCIENVFARICFAYFSIFSKIFSNILIFRPVHMQTNLYLWQTHGTNDVNVMQIKFIN